MNKTWWVPQLLEQGHLAQGATSIQPGHLVLWRSKEDASADLVMYRNGRLFGLHSSRKAGRVEANLCMLHAHIVG